MTAPVEAPAAHETAAVLRIQRAGMSGPQICHALKMSALQLIAELRLAMDDEQEAHRVGLPIYDSPWPKNVS